MARSLGTSVQQGRNLMEPPSRHLGSDTSGDVLRLVLADAAGVGLTQGSRLHPASPEGVTQTPGLDHKSKDRSELQMPGNW